MQRRIFVPLALALLASAGSAQIVRFNALVEKVAPDPCTGLEFQVESSDVLLQSGLVHLADSAGSIVLLKGPLQPPGACPSTSVFVEVAEPPTATLEVCGTAALGCPLRFRIGPPTVSVNMLALSTQPQGFLPLLDPLGVSFLTPPLIVVGSAGPGGILDVTVPSGAPVGIEVTFQALHQDVGPILGPGWVSNPIRRQIVVAFTCQDPTACF